MKAGGGAVQAEFGAVQSLSITVCGQGHRGGGVGEEARCTGAGERNVRKVGRAAADTFYDSSVVRAERKGGREVWGRRLMEEGEA
jgi:hypothetical protein